MKLKIIILIISLFTIITGILLIKMNFPLTFKENQINIDAQKYVIDLQDNLKLESYECAIKYLYYKTDYHNIIPNGIKVTIKNGSNNIHIVVIYDSSCEDDSEYETMDRIYLKKENDIWKPIKHDWSHKGRGRFGWTTEPTT